MGDRRWILCWGAGILSLGVAGAAAGTALVGPVGGGVLGVALASVGAVVALFWNTRATCRRFAECLRTVEEETLEGRADIELGACPETLRQSLLDLAQQRSACSMREAELKQLRVHAARVEEELLRLGELSDRLSEGAEGQEGTVNRTTASVEALADRIDCISASAENAAAAGELTRQQAAVGLEKIRELTAGMERLQDHVELNSRKLHRLGDRLSEIGSIVDLIGGLSSRTDMLALNATIESVRAGEHGRGFAVVAEEIRKLAERAASGTREIGTLVEAIHDDAQETFQALAEQQAEMERESQRIRDANDALERITHEAGTSAQLIKEISSSANHQVVATQDLVSAIQQVSESAQLILRETGQLRGELHQLQPAMTEVAGRKPASGIARPRVGIRPGSPSPSLPLPATPTRIG